MFRVKYYYDDTLIRKSDSAIMKVNQVGGMTTDNEKATEEMFDKYEVKEISE